MKNFININFYKYSIGIGFHFLIVMIMFSCNNKQNHEIDNVIRFEEDVQQYSNTRKVKTARPIEDLQGKTYGVTQINEHLLTTENHNQQLSTNW